ncbi:MAG: protein YgfX [Thiobacillus sp.]
MVMTEIKLKRSVWLIGLISAMVLLAGLSIARAYLPAWTLMTLVAGLLGTMIYVGWSMRKPLPGLRIKPDGQIQISISNGEWQSTELMTGSYVSSGLSVVRLRSPHEMHRLVLLPDSATSDELRRLRLSLRWAPRTRSDTAFPGAD